MNKLYFGFTFSKSLAINKSSPKFKFHRQLNTKILQVSQNKPHFYRFFYEAYQESLEEHKTQIENGENFDLLEFNGVISRAMISKILYGQELEDTYHDYVLADGSKQKLRGDKFIAKTMDDFLLEAFSNPYVLASYGRIYDFDLAARFFPQVKANLINTEGIWKVCLQLIKDRRALYEQKGGDLKKERPDFLDMFMPYILKGEVTEEELQHTFLMMFFAGNDTSSHTLSTFMYRMYKEPEVLAKLREEAKQAFP